MSKPLTITKVQIRSLGRDHFEITLDDEVIANGKNVERDACKVLHTRGVTGVTATYWPGEFELWEV